MAMTGKQSINQKLRVLIVEAEPDGQQLLAAQVLESWPFLSSPKLDYAINLAEALKLSRARRYALVVIEAGLAWQSGRGQLRVLRQQAQRVPMVLVSSQDRHVLELDLAGWGGTHVSKSQLNALSFQRAIAHSLALVSRLPRVAPTSRTSAGV